MQKFGQGFEDLLEIHTEVQFFHRVEFGENTDFSGQGDRSGFCPLVSNNRSNSSISRQFWIGLFPVRVGKGEFRIQKRGRGEWSIFLPSDGEIKELETLLKTGQDNSRTLTRVRIL